MMNPMDEDIRKLELVTEDADSMKIAEKMATDISKMYEDRDKKAMAGHKRLVDQLEVVAQKYHTANGVMVALGCVRDVFGANASELMLTEEIGIAKDAANEVSKTVVAMRDKLMAFDPDDPMLKNFCDEFYDSSFSTSRADPIAMVTELMKLTLCQQIGPDAADLFDFCLRADEEIDKAKQNLMKYCKDNDIDFDKLCEGSNQ